MSEIHIRYDGQIRPLHLCKDLSYYFKELQFSFERIAMGPGEKYGHDLTEDVL